MTSYSNSIKKRFGLGCLILLLILTIGFFLFQRAHSPSKHNVKALVESEELFLKLSSRAAALNQSFLNQDESKPEGLFHLEFKANPYTKLAEFSSRKNNSLFERTVSNEKSLKTLEFLPLRTPLTEYQKIDRAKITLVAGEFKNSQKNLYETSVYIDCLGKSKDGYTMDTHATATLSWKKDQQLWKIHSWRNESLRQRKVQNSAFVDVTQQALGPIHDSITHSRHEDHLRDILLNKGFVLSKDFAPYFRIDASGQHPSISVVDIDNDGWDDLFLTSRWKPTVLLKNQGDGTFKDETKRFGLAVPDMCTSALFADFDNDGDPDVFIGRSLKRSIYFENINGYFVNQSSTSFLTELPYLVSSLSAADINQDGLLDIYVSTYGFPGSSPDVSVWGPRFLPKAQAGQFIRRSKKSNRFVDLVGPPNALFLNQGNGQFKDIAPGSPLEVWRSSLQATFSDFDRDGDPDLYIANDFAPDNFLVNESGQFIDKTQELGGSALQGFGMGADFGDYDNDGDFDLYVSNMFSKAGKRITKQIEGINRRFSHAAEGNILMRNDDFVKFSHVSGEKEENIHVSKAGWSWGGQFADFNNDGFLDLYVPNGFFTAPKGFEAEDDL